MLQTCREVSLTSEEIFSLLETEIQAFQGISNECLKELDPLGQKALTDWLDGWSPFEELLEKELLKTGR